MKLVHVAKGDSIFFCKTRQHLDWRQVLLEIVDGLLCFPCIGAVLLKSNPRSVPCFSIVASRGSEERSPPGEL